MLQAHTSAITQMEWHEDKQALLTCAKDKCFKIWQFPTVWVDEQGVDLQRPTPSATASAKKKNNPAVANAAAADSDDSDDDGLGRIRSNGQKATTLPQGLGQVFNTSNPLASAK